MISDLLKFVAASTVLLGMVTWLFKSLMAHFLNKDVERYKEQLRTESAMEVERFKHDLQRQATEHQIRYSNLHEEMASTIAETYGKLHTFYRRVLIYLHDLRLPSELTPEEEEQALNDAEKEFSNYYERWRIYISPALTDQIDEIAQKLRLSIRKEKRRQQIAELGHGYSESTDEEWDKINDEIDNLYEDLQSLFTNLETEFRRLLGFDDQAFADFARPQNEAGGS